MDTVRNLGWYCDRHMELDRLVSSYCSSAYYSLCLISRIWHLLTRDAYHAAVCCHVLSHLDCCNGGLNNGLTNRLQWAQNLAARVINHVRWRDHITLTMQWLGWLPITMIFTLKICTYMYKILHCLAPDYLNRAIVHYARSRALRLESDTTFLTVTVPRGTVGLSSGRPIYVKQLAKVCEINWDIGSFPKATKNSRILLTLHYLPWRHWFIFYDIAWF